MASVSIKDVAAAAGVSVGTVSNVLNRPDAVRPTTRAKVEAAIARARLRPQRVGPPARGRTQPHAGLPRPRRVEPLLHRRHAGDRGGRQDREPLALHLQQRPGRRPRGPVPRAAHPAARARRPHHGDRLRQPTAGPTARRRVSPSSSSTGRRRTPTTGARWASTTSPVASSPSATSSSQATAPRLHRRPPRDPAGRATATPGRARPWTPAGLSPDDLVWIQTDALTIAEGRRAGERLLGLPRRSRPTGVFCANDLLALGLLQHLAQHGVRVPDDIAIVGYDDIEYAAAAAVPAHLGRPATAPPRPHGGPPAHGRGGPWQRARAPARRLPARARRPGVHGRPRRRSRLHEDRPVRHLPRRRPLPRRRQGDGRGARAARPRGRLPAGPDVLRPDAHQHRLPARRGRAGAPPRRGVRAGPGRRLRGGRRAVRVVRRLGAPPARRARPPRG